MLARFISATLTCLLLGWPMAGLAQPTSWPTRPVKFILPLGAGSGVDIGARLLAQKLQAKWGQGVVIENRPGGDGLISVTAFLSARDDHVLLFASPGSFTVHPFQHEKLPYSFDRDLLPIAQFSNTIIAIAASSDTGAQSLRQLVENAKASPGRFNSAVPAGIGELILDNFIKSEGLATQKVPYRDIVQASHDLAAGRLQVMMGSYAMLQPATEGGRARILAVNSRERMPSAPAIPTAIEAGFPSLELEGLVGLFGMREVHGPMQKRIASDVVEVSADPAMAERLLHTGQVLNPAGSAEFEASIQRQIEQVSAIAQYLGMKAK